MIEAQLPTNWRSLAEQHGQLRKVSPHLGAKIKDAGQLLRLVLHYVASNSSLQTTTAAFYAADMVDLSDAGLHKRMKRIGPYLADLVTQMSGTRDAFRPERWAGYDVIATDGSVVCRPGAKGTTARVHYALRLSDLRLLHCEVTDETGGETLRRFDVQAEQLWIGDRIYANPPAVLKVARAGAALLVRVNLGALPLYDEEGTRLDVRALAQTLTKPGAMKEWTARVLGPKQQTVRGRLCVLRLPEDKIAEARERVRKEHGADTTEEQLAMAEYVVLFTTVPRARLELEQLFELYRLRWQVELRIKRDKSIGGLDRLPNFLPETIHAWLCAKLLALEITRKLATAEVAFPPGAIGVAALRAGCGEAAAA